MADLKGSGVDDFDCVWVVRVERFSDKTHHFSTTDFASVILQANYVGDDKAKQVSVGGRLGR